MIQVPSVYPYRSEITVSKGGLHKVGIDTVERGFIVVDDQLRTNVPNVRAIISSWHYGNAHNIQSKEFVKLARIVTP